MSGSPSDFVYPKVTVPPRPHPEPLVSLIGTPGQYDILRDRFPDSASTFMGSPDLPRPFLPIDLPPTPIAYRGADAAIPGLVPPGAPETPRRNHLEVNAFGDGVVHQGVAPDHIPPALPIDVRGAGAAESPRHNHLEVNAFGDGAVHQGVAPDHIPPASPIAVRGAGAPETPRRNLLEVNAFGDGAVHQGVAPDHIPPASPPTLIAASSEQNDHGDYFDVDDVDLEADLDGVSLNDYADSPMVMLERRVMNQLVFSSKIIEKRLEAKFDKLFFLNSNNAGYEGAIVDMFLVTGATTWKIKPLREKDYKHFSPEEYMHVAQSNIRLLTPEYVKRQKEECYLKNLEQD
jgi:stage V sporulation protein SpoVS